MSDSYLNINEKVKALFPLKELKSSCIVTGHWDCPSDQDEKNSYLSKEDIPVGKNPTKHCIYNTEEDPCCDYCLFCGLPDERK